MKNYYREGFVLYSVTMNKEIESYLLRATDLAESTKLLYRHYLVYFAVWLKFNKKKWEEATSNDLIDYLNEQTGWSESTRYNCVCACRSFYKYAFGDNHAINYVKVKRHDPPPQRSLNWDKLSTLMSSFDTSTPKGIRDLAIVTLLVDSGLRAAEICRLDLKYLNMDDRCFNVLIKGGKWGAGSFFDYSASCLQTWLNIRANYAHANVTTVFVSIGGLTPGASMTKDGMRSVFRKFRVCDEIGLISPHDMRRTFCTLSLRSGAPTRVVQVAGRWSSTKMVERYSQTLVAEDMRPYSPVNRLMGVEQ